MQQIILRVAVRSMKQQAMKQNLRWNDPQEVIDGDGDVSYCWFGNGPQGSEPARLMLCVDEGNVLICMVISRFPFDFDHDLYRAYHQYLQVNQWAPLSFTLWFEVTLNRVRRRFKGVMRRFSLWFSTLFSDIRGSKDRIT